VKEPPSPQRGRSKSSRILPPSGFAPQTSVSNRRKEVVKWRRAGLLPRECRKPRDGVPTKAGSGATLARQRRHKSHARAREANHEREAESWAQGRVPACPLGALATTWRAILEHLEVMGR
jgi:hypothetical protein